MAPIHHFLDIDRYHSSITVILSDIQIPIRILQEGARILTLEHANTNTNVLHLDILFNTRANYTINSPKIESNLHATLRHRFETSISSIPANLELLQEQQQQQQDEPESQEEMVRWFVISRHPCQLSVPCSLGESMGMKEEGQSGREK